MRRVIAAVLSAWVVVGFLCVLGAPAWADFGGDTAWVDIPATEGEPANHVVAHGVTVTDSDVFVSVEVAALDEPALSLGAIKVEYDTDGLPGAEWVLQTWRSTAAPFISGDLDPADDLSHRPTCAGLPVIVDFASRVLTTRVPLSCMGDPTSIAVRLRWGTGDYTGSRTIPADDRFTPAVGKGQRGGVLPVLAAPADQPPLGWSDPVDTADAVDDVLGYGVSLEQDTVRVSVLLRALTPRSLHDSRLAVSVDANGDGAPDWLLQSLDNAGNGPVGSVLPAAQLVDPALCRATRVLASAARRVVTVSAPRRCFDDPVRIGVRLTWVTGGVNGDGTDVDDVPSAGGLSPTVTLGQAAGIAPVLTGDDMAGVAAPSPAPGPTQSAAAAPSTPVPVSVIVPVPVSAPVRTPVPVSTAPVPPVATAGQTLVAPVRTSSKPSVTRYTAGRRWRIDLDRSFAGRTVSARVHIGGRTTYVGTVRLNDRGDGSVTLRRVLRTPPLRNGIQVFVVWGRSVVAVPRLR